MFLIFCEDDALFDILPGQPFLYSAGTTFWLFCGDDILKQNITLWNVCKDNLRHGFCV